MPFIEKTRGNHVYIQIGGVHWLSKFHSDWRETSKSVNLKISAKVQVCDFGQNLKMSKSF